MSEALKDSLQALIDQGLTFSDCMATFTANQSEAEKAYIAAAREFHEREGDLEFDDHVMVSMGNDDGAYVLAWKWVEDTDAGVCSECKAPVCDPEDGECPECGEEESQ